MRFFFLSVYINITFFTGWHGRSSPRESDNAFQGWRSTMSSRKECNIHFIIANVPISYTTLISCYQITLRTGRHFWMSPVAMTLLRMPWRSPLVSQFEPYALIFAHVTFLECHPPFYSPSKKPCDIQKFHPFNGPIKSQETEHEV